MSDAVKATAVTAKSGSTCTADIAGVTTTIQVARDVTVAAGDALLVLKAGPLWVAVCRLYAAAPAAPAEPPAAPPDPKPSVTTGKLVVAPVATGTYRDGKWRTDDDDLRQGKYGGYGNNTGAAFYGTKPQSLSGATVTRATIRVRRPDAGGANAKQATTLRLVTQIKKPGGAPTLTSSTSGPNLRRGSTDDSFDIPTSWAQAMVDGTAGGLAIFDSSGSPYVILSGRGDWSPAFTLTIYWQRG
jgi:hypothetical protein